MDKVSKMLGAGAGGLAAGAGTGLIMLPENSPWYAYVIMAAITTILPMLAAYIAPRNAD